MKKTLSNHDRGRLNELIAEMEKRTRTQIVMGVIKRSDTYVELPWKGFALGASIAGLLVFILDLPFYDWYPRMTALLAVAVTLAGGAAFALLTILVPGFAKRFLSANRAEVEVRQYAQSLFLDRELFATSNRSGILLLVSLFERKVIVLPDKGLGSQLTEKTMQIVINTMIPFLKRNEVYQAFKAGLERLSQILGTAAPGTGGKNELPDEIIEEMTGRVTDNAQILSTETCRTLTESLKEHESRTGNQIAVLTVSTLNGENIEDYAVKVFKAWKLGQKGKDNGILMVVAPNDRCMRIEVGYGLEGTLTDGTAGQIIRTIMTPRFKNGDYNGGITVGARAVMVVLEGGQLPAGEAGQAGNSDTFLFQGPDLPIKERILIGAFIFGIIGLFTIIGILTPGVGWFLYIFLIPFWAMFPVIVLGTRGAFICLITYLIVFPVTKLLFKNTKWYKKAKKDLRRKGRANIGGFRFRTGGSSGRSWSSGSSSFSGGGGSSGGGGASGSW